MELFFDKQTEAELLLMCFLKIDKMKAMSSK